MTNYVKKNYFQENGPAKRFKPSPILVSKDESSLKIRISRYGTAPGRSQQANKTSSSPDKQVSSATGRNAASSPGRSVGSPRLARAASHAAANNAAASAPLAAGSTTTTNVTADTVKKEESGGGQQEIKMCEVRISNISSIKNEKSDPSSPSASSCGETGSGSDTQRPSTPSSVDRLNVSENMTASEIIEACKVAGPVKDGNIPTSLLEDCPKPKRRAHLPKLSPSQLLPATPCVHVKNKQGRM